MKSAGVTRGTLGIASRFAASCASCLTGNHFSPAPHAHSRRGSGCKSWAVVSMSLRLSVFNLGFFIDRPPKRILLLLLFSKQARRRQDLTCQEALGLTPGAGKCRDRRSGQDAPLDPTRAGEDLVRGKLSGATGRPACPLRRCRRTSRPSTDAAARTGPTGRTPPRPCSARRGPAPPRRPRAGWFVSSASQSRNVERKP